MKRFKFEKTPIMSTYLLAFVVGEYDYIEDKDRNGILIRVYTPLGKKEQGQFALDVSKKFYNNRQNMDYTKYNEQSNDRLLLKPYRSMRIISE